MIQRACYSDPGRQRGQNEDACALPPAGVDEVQFGTLLVIADGTGGLPGGAEASRQAVGHLQALYYADPAPLDFSERLRQSVEGVNALNRLEQRRLGQQPGHLTTLVAALIHTDQVWVANVGDSRAYLANANTHELVQLTEDHSSHVRDVKVGLVSDADLASRESGIITRAIGLQDDCQVDIYHYTWESGDRLLLCSDGLSHLATEAMASTILDHAPEEAARDLVVNAVETDGSDNCTAVVAAWLPDELPGSSADASEVANRAARPTLLSPTRKASARQSPGIPSSRWFVPPPGAWLVFFGVLLGWLSAAILVVLLVLK